MMYHYVEFNNIFVIYEQGMSPIMHLRAKFKDNRHNKKYPTFYSSLTQEEIVKIVMIISFNCNNKNWNFVILFICLNKSVNKLHKKHCRMKY